jgi:hypothetical protein
MKYLLILLFTFPTYCQSAPPDLRNFTELGRSDARKVMYLVNSKDASVSGPNVIFDGLAANFKADVDGTYALNNIAYVVTTFKADCDRMTAVKLRELGKWPKESPDGTITVEPIDLKYDPPFVEKVEKGNMLYIAVQKVCKDRVGLTALHEINHATGLVL